MIPVLPVVASVQCPAVGIMPSKLPIPVRPSKRPSLDERLNRLELEWAEPPVASTSHYQKPRAFSLKTWDPPASERALAAEMVGGVVRSVLSAPRGESLLTQKKRARQTYPAFGFVAELVAQAAVDARLGALALCRPPPRPMEKRSVPSTKALLQRRPPSKEPIEKNMVPPTKALIPRRPLPKELSVAFGRRWLQHNPVPKKIEARSSSGGPTQAPKRVRVSGRAPDSDVRPDLASAASTAPVAQSVSSVPEEQYPFFPYIDGELDRILQETDACLDDTMDVGAASAVQVVAEMSFRSLIADDDYVELQPLANE